MPWVTPHYRFGEREMGYVMLGPCENGWHGSLKISGVSIPKWTAGFCAGAIAILSLVRSIGIIRVPEMIPFLFALYGLLYTGAIIVGIIYQPSPIQTYAGGYRQGISYQSIGIGVILAFACFFALLYLSYGPLRVATKRVYDASCKSLIWSRCKLSINHVEVILKERRNAFIIILIAIALFICFAVISYFYYSPLEILGFGIHTDNQ